MVDKVKLSPRVVSLPEALALASQSDSVSWQVPPIKHVVQSRHSSEFTTPALPQMGYLGRGRVERGGSLGKHQGSFGETLRRRAQLPRSRKGGCRGHTRR